MINMNASLGTSLSVSKLGTGIYTVINDNNFLKIYSYVKIRGSNQSPGGYELNKPTHSSHSIPEDHDSNFTSFSFPSQKVFEKNFKDFLYIPM